MAWWKSRSRQRQRRILEPTWILHVDEASNSLGNGAGLILMNSEGVVTEYALRFSIKASNDQTKYEALLARLKITKAFEVKKLRTFIDSQLMIDQTKEELEAWDPSMAKYLQKVQTLILEFESFDISYIFWAENARAALFLYLWYQQLTYSEEHISNISKGPALMETSRCIKWNTSRVGWTRSSNS